jgi:GT2 family glycosyltransferase
VEKEIQAIAGCFMLVRREAMEQVGLMAEDYFMYSEDTDWCWRFYTAGWKILYSPAPKFMHIHKASSSKCAPQMLIYQRRSVLMFMEKKSGKFVRWIANTMFILSSALKLPILLVRRLLGKIKSEDWQNECQSVRAVLMYHCFNIQPDICSAK